MKPGFNRIISLDNGKTVTTKYYINESLRNVLKQVDKYRHLDDKTTQIIEYLDTKYVKSIDYSAYSPNLYPCNFSLFYKIKEQFHGENFQDI
jgi:hypothetical protein